MANDCLQTKLKSSINNNKLDMLGALPIYVRAEGTCTKFYVSKSGILVHPDGTEESFDAGDISSKFSATGVEQKYYIKNEKYSDFTVTCDNPRSGLGENNLVYIKTEDLQYRNAGPTIGTVYYSVPLVGNIGDIFKYGNATTDIVYFTFRAPNFILSGTDDDFRAFISKVPNIKTIISGTYKNGTFLVNFTILSEETNCAITELFGGGYKGDMYSFIQKARSSNRTEGEIDISYWNRDNSVYFNGEALPNECKTLYGHWIWTNESVTLKIRTSSSSWQEYQTWNI